MDLNKLARTITKEEGKKINLSIAQVKEVMGLLLRKLKGLSVKELTEIFKKVK